MATIMDNTLTTQVYRVYIQATPEAVWQAITDPDWNAVVRSSTSVRAGPTSASRTRR